MSSLKPHKRGRSWTSKEECWAGRKSCKTRDKASWTWGSSQKKPSSKLVLLQLQSSLVIRPTNVVLFWWCAVLMHVRCEYVCYELVCLVMWTCDACHMWTCDSISTVTLVCLVIWTCDACHIRAHKQHLKIRKEYEKFIVGNLVIE
jgi:hypothetical protein